VKGEDNRRQGKESRWGLTSYGKPLGTHIRSILQCHWGLTSDGKLGFATVDRILPFPTVVLHKAEPTVRFPHPQPRPEMALPLRDSDCSSTTSQGRGIGMC
jgi:hypothetical protein